MIPVTVWILFIIAGNTGTNTVGPSFSNFAECQRVGNELQLKASNSYKCVKSKIIKSSDDADLRQQIAELKESVNVLKEQVHNLYSDDP